MKLEFVPIEHIPEIRTGMDLASVLRPAMEESGITLQPQDILAVTQKIISKAEGRVVDLGGVEPSTYSAAIARRMNKDARLIEVILRESRRIVRVRGDVLICETHQGFICANAGVDQSNMEGAEMVSLLPKNPDLSARRLARDLGCGIIVTDTFGRVWREGLVDTAIGVAKVPVFVDFRGTTDSFGRPLQATLLAAADSLAATAGLVMGKTSRTPAVVIRGFHWQETASNASMLLRTPERDLFL
jgi:coenzyme F420-0:L-glutamate ligase/coenzyme F420-1:gamma-L-glutamate ligase